MSTLIVPLTTVQGGRLFVGLTLAVQLSTVPSTVASKNAVDCVLLTTLKLVGSAGTVKQQTEEDTSRKLTNSHELKD